MTDAIRKAAQDFSDYVHAEQSSTDGAVQYSTTQINRLVFAIRAALQSCPDCGKPMPPDSVHTCSPQKPDDVVCEWAHDDATDAKRYRWLRDHAKRDWLDAGITDDAVDEAINDRSQWRGQKL